MEKQFDIFGSIGTGNLPDLVFEEYDEPNLVICHSGAEITLRLNKEKFLKMLGLDIKHHAFEVIEIKQDRNHSDILRLKLGILTELKLFDDQAE